MLKQFKTRNEFEIAEMVMRFYNYKHNYQYKLK